MEGRGWENRDAINHDDNDREDDDDEDSRPTREAR